jgi:glycosyl transferase family 25
MQSFQILVISLIRSKDRRIKVAQEFSKTSLEWSFIDAIDGSLFSSLPSQYCAKKVRRLQGYDLTKSEIACYLSHRQTWQSCILNNQITLVLEDDFSLAPNISTILQSIVEHSKDWDLLRLQGLYEVGFKQIKDFGIIQLVQNSGDAVGATAYMLNPQAAQKLLNYSKEIYEPLDHFLEHEKKHGVTFLAIKPYIVKNSGIESTISDRPQRIPLKRFSKLRRSYFRMIDRIFNRDPWFP